MGVLIFVFGGLCFMGLTIICYVYFVSRTIEELNRDGEKMLESILEYLQMKEQLLKEAQEDV